MNIFDDMDEAAVIISQRFDTDAVTLALGARVSGGKYTPEWEASLYSARTKYTSLRGKGNSFVEATNNLVVAVKAFEAATIMQTNVTHVERNVLQLAAPEKDAWDVADEVAKQLDVVDADFVDVPEKL